MGSFVPMGDYYVLSGQTSDKVEQELQGLMTAHNDIMDFIFASAKQMAAFVQNQHNDTSVLRTPSRRTSRRKRSSATAKLLTPKIACVSVSTAKKCVTSAFTPRRFSKRAKRSTLRLDTTVEEKEVAMEVEEEEKEVVSHQVMPPMPITQCNVNDLDTNVETNDRISVEMVDEVVESVDIVEDKTEPKTELNEHICKTVDIVEEIKTVLASELMSELSIREDTDEVKAKPKKPNHNPNDSDNEWMTDDEDCQQKMETEEFYDAVDAREVANKLNSSVGLTTIKSFIPKSSSKDNRKKSQYFTPQTTAQRSTRAQTRMLSRIADSAQKTPQTTSLASKRKDSAQTDDSAEKRMAGSSSTRSMRSYSRIQNKVSDNKTMTASAQKRRLEAEEQRRQKLMASQEKEKRAIEKRRILLEQTVNEKKIKYQEKANRAAELRERQKLMEEERLQKEREKREEWERKREEERRLLLRKKQEEMAQNAREKERRKQMQELKEMEVKMKKREELARKQELEREKQREQEKMAALIQQHNISLQQKALANSFIKKCDSSAQLVPKVMVTKLSPAEVGQHMATKATKISPNEPKAVDNEPVLKAEIQSKDQTFVVTKDDSKDVSSYDMTPPPKEHDYDNYDISEIQSDDDTDDEERPRKRIPPWARGQAFIQQVHQQYGKSYKQVYKEVKASFGSGDALLRQFKVDFDIMFAKKGLHPKYAKRTSSAVWELPPQRYRMNESSINESFL